MTNNKINHNLITHFVYVVYNIDVLLLVVNQTLDVILVGNDITGLNIFPLDTASLIKRIE